MVRGEVKVTNDLLPTSRQGHIVNLNIPGAQLDLVSLSTSHYSPGVTDFPRLTLATRVLSMPWLLLDPQHLHGFLFFSDQDGQLRPSGLSE